MTPFYQKHFDQMSILQMRRYVFQAKIDQMQNKTKKF